MTGSAVIQAIVADIASDPVALRELAAALVPQLESRDASSAEGWLEARAAAEYLGLPSVDQLHKLTAARLIPFSQERPRAKCYFRRADLDRYRERYMQGPAQVAGPGQEA